MTEIEALKGKIAELEREVARLRPRGRLLCWHQWTMIDWGHETVARGPYGVKSVEVHYYQCVKCGRKMTM